MPRAPSRRRAHGGGARSRHDRGGGQDPFRVLRIALVCRGRHRGNSPQSGEGRGAVHPGDTPRGQGTARGAAAPEIRVRSHRHTRTSRYARGTLFRRRAGEGHLRLLHLRNRGGGQRHARTARDTSAYKETRRQRKDQTSAVRHIARLPQISAGQHSHGARRQIRHSRKERVQGSDKRSSWSSTTSSRRRSSTNRRR